MRLLNISEKKQYNILEKASTIAGAIGIRTLIKQGWKSYAKKEPPENPASPLVPWKEALIWGAATGLTVGLMKIVTRRATAASWRKYKGALP